MIDIPVLQNVHPRYSKSDKDLIAQLYIDGMSKENICEKFECSIATVNKAISQYLPTHAQILEVMKINYARSN